MFTRLLQIFNENMKSNCMPFIVTIPGYRASYTRVLDQVIVRVFENHVLHILVVIIVLYQNFILCGGRPHVRRP